MITRKQWGKQPELLPCAACGGTGFCARCSGNGRYAVGSQVMLVDCGTCRGSGACAACRGTGRVAREAGRWQPFDVE